MSDKAALLWIHALTPLRVGVDAGLGAINLPTMREVHTGHPIIPGSSLKGVLRADEPDLRRQRQLFGPDREQAHEHRGALAFTDARLVALPVRSLRGTFAWCTSAGVLRRLNRDRAEAELKPPLEFPTTLKAEVAVASGSALAWEKDGKTRVFIEDFDVGGVLDPRVDAMAQRLAGEIWPDDSAAAGFFSARLAVLPDDVLDALARTAMEIRTRVPIDPETGTAAKSGPWTEEAMPTETLLAALVVGRGAKTSSADKDKDGKPTWTEPLTAEQALALFRVSDASRMLRLGGHNTVGLGRAALSVVG